MKRFKTLAVLTAVMTGVMMNNFTLNANAETNSLSDYIQSYDTLKKAGYQMFSGNQVLLTFDLMVQVNGCVIEPDSMEWTVSGTADTTFVSGVCSDLTSSDFPYYPVKAYCLITANSPGTVQVEGIETAYGKPITSHGIYWNLNVDETGNFDGTVNHDEPVEPADSVPDDDTQRVSVIDYDTKELIQFEDDQEYSISFHTGYDVEYVLTDGTFAWGTMWGETSEWDYNAQNPYVIDVSSHAGGFGVSGYEAFNMDLPDGYFLPEDYLETVEYDNGSADIYIKLKKTLSGDVNDDGEFSVLDVITLQKWLLGDSDTHLSNWKAADFTEDNQLNVFDLLLMKKALIQKNQEQFDYSIAEQKSHMRKNIDQHEGEAQAYIAHTYDEFLAIVESAEGEIDELSVTDGLDEAFFEDNAVIVMYTIARSSDTFTLIDNIEPQQDKLMISNEVIMPLAPIPDMVYDRNIIVVNQADIQNITSIDIQETIRTYDSFDIEETEATFDYVRSWTMRNISPINADM